MTRHLRTKAIPCWFNKLDAIARAYDPPRFHKGAKDRKSFAHVGRVISGTCPKMTQSARWGLARRNWQGTQVTVTIRLEISYSRRKTCATPVQLTLPLLCACF